MHVMRHAEVKSGVGVPLLGGKAVQPDRLGIALRNLKGAVKQQKVPKGAKK